MATILIKCEKAPAQLKTTGWFSNVMEISDAPGITTAEGEEKISKNAAWASIKDEVEAIDFTNNTVFFNGETVTSLEEILERLENL